LPQVAPDTEPGQPWQILLEPVVNPHTGCGAPITFTFELKNSSDKHLDVPEMPVMRISLRISLTLKGEEI
jgi:hypothetical protein